MKGGWSKIQKIGGIFAYVPLIAKILQKDKFELGTVLLLKLTDKLVSLKESVEEYNRTMKKSCTYEFINRKNVLIKNMINNVNSL